MITKVTSLLGSWVVLLGAWQASAADLEISIPIQITHAQNFDPSPSPDGKKLVFISMLSGKEQLFTMDVDGKNIAQLTRDDADLFLDQELRVTDNVDEQDMPNFKAKIVLRFRCHNSSRPVLLRHS